MNTFGKSRAVLRIIVFSCCVLLFCSGFGFLGFPPERLCSFLHTPIREPERVRLSDEYNIATFASKHNQIDTKLKELKNIIIKYYPEKENNNLLNAVLFDIFNCEQDLATHCQVEDYMFVLNFSLTAPEGAKLEISYIGMNSQTVKAGSNMKIVLNPKT